MWDNTIIYCNQVKYFEMQKAHPPTVGDFREADLRIHEAI